MKEQCLVCNRISPKYVAMFVHKIFDEIADKDTIHKIIIDACNAINYADNKKRVALCGRSKASILSGLLYWLGFRYGCVVTQRYIASCFPAKIKHFWHDTEGETFTEVAVSESAKFWAKEFPELIKEEIKKRDQLNKSRRHRGRFQKH